MSRKFKRNKYANLLSSLYLLLITSLCICSCTSEYNIFDSNNSNLLNFTVSVPEWKNNDSTSNSKTRAMPVSGSSLDKASSFNIIADAYDGKSNYSTIINKESVSFTNNMWQTVAPHYWPGTANNTVNFYAYYPTSISSSITHTAGFTPTFSYTVPDKVSDQIDIMTATGNNVSGNTNSSTSLSFNHIFAAVQFSVGSAGMPTGTITGIALNNILYKGTYSLNGTWTQDATSKKTFSQDVSSSTNTGTTITSGATTFMMIPQTLGSDASITITYSNGGTLTKSISGNWEAGKIYTYNISKIIQTANFNYTGDVQTYTIPLDGTYKIECWGSCGGGNSTTIGGKGGYVCGNLKLTRGSILYVYVGEKGDIFDESVPLTTETYNSTKDPSDAVLFTLGRTGHIIFNNGGESVSVILYNKQNWTYAGGGSTDIRLSNGKWNDFNSLKTRILVAAGGGGACTYNTNLNGADAGSLLGLSGKGNGGRVGNDATGGEQNQGGLHGTGDHMYPSTPRAGFGYTSYNYVTTGGGGNGYYAGGNGNHGCGTVGSGASGSSFISGYSGCNAIDKSSTSDNITHTGSPNHYSGYIFTNSQMIAGNASMPAPSGGTEIGHTGNGYARITFISAN
ncbi:fimbrillin family protein [Xylanibacter oryzae]|uniref:fimbrillin family protein n=1 Tax=Xylanibacter oryzae TaxID=185293 RepID=UPI0004B5B9DD|nr:fimbrillin family protein [Xylanibacter oryzae]